MVSTSRIENPKTLSIPPVAQEDGPARGMDVVQWLVRVGIKITKTLGSIPQADGPVEGGGGRGEGRV